VYDPKKSERFLMGCRYSPSAEETEIPEVPHQMLVDNFFDSQAAVNNEIVPEGKNSNCRII
jgi:hypothetical protein